MAFGRRPKVAPSLLDTLLFVGGFCRAMRLAITRSPPSHASWFSGETIAGILCLEDRGEAPATRKPQYAETPPLTDHKPAQANNGLSSRPYQVRVRAPVGPSGRAKSSTMIRQRASGTSRRGCAGHSSRNQSAVRFSRGNSATPVGTMAPQRMASIRRLPLSSRTMSPVRPGQSSADQSAWTGGCASKSEATSPSEVRQRYNLGNASLPAHHSLIRYAFGKAGVMCRRRSGPWLRSVLP